MITEIILVIFALLYYSFSICAFGVYIQNTEDISFIKSLGEFIITIILSPVAIPILLGLELGKWLRNS